MNVAEIISKSNFFSILMDGSTILEKEKEGSHIQSFQRKWFMKGGNPTITPLLNLPDLCDISAYADALKDLLVLLMNTAWITICWKSLIQSAPI